MFELIIEDLDSYAYRLGLPKWTAPLMIFLYPATWAILVYRFGHWVHNWDVPLIRHFFLIIYFILKRITEVFTNIQISSNTTIGKGIFIAHLGDIVISSGSKIGKYPSIHQGITIGGAGRGKKYGDPIVGDFVYLGAGAKLIGKIEVGNDVMIGANAVVTKSIPDNASVGGIPAEIINYKGSKDFIHFREN
jgi:serine O-acetyltransferase